MYRQIHVGCLLLKYQVRISETSEGYLYRIHDLLTRCVHRIIHLQVLLTSIYNNYMLRCTFIIPLLGELVKHL